MFDMPPILQSQAPAAFDNQDSLALPFPLPPMLVKVGDSLVESRESVLPWQSGAVSRPAIIPMVITDTAGTVPQNVDLSQTVVLNAGMPDNRLAPALINARESHMPVLSVLHPVKQPVTNPLVNAAITAVSSESAAFAVSGESILRDLRAADETGGQATGDMLGREPLPVFRELPMMPAPVDTAAVIDDMPATSPIAHRVIEQVTRAAQTGLTGELREISLRLDPPALGAVHVRITAPPGQEMVTHIETASPMVREMLDAHLPELQRSLTDAGIAVGQCKVLLNFQLGQQSSQEGRQAWAGRLSGAPVTLPPADAPVLPPSTRVARGRLDYFA